MRVTAANPQSRRAEQASGRPATAGNLLDAPATLFGLCAQAASFWAVVAVLPDSGVTRAAWIGLHVFTAVALVVIGARARWSAGRWLAALFYAVFVALIFYFLDIGLDILHGPNRPKANVAAYLGGLELCFFLCPGVAALAAGGLARALLTQRWQRAHAP